MAQKAVKQQKNNPVLEKILTFIKGNPILLIIIVVLTVYSNTLFNGFVWDDEEQIVNNSLIHSLKNFNLFLYGGTFNLGGANELSGWFFRPLVNITFAILYSIFKLNAWGYHLFSILIHLLNSILIFKILNKIDERKNKIFSILLALIFATHPGILEAVSYISASADLIVASSLLGSIYLILNYKDSYKTKYPIVTALLILTGLLYKESAFAILPILLTFLFVYKEIIVHIKSWITAVILPFIIYFILRIPLAGQHIQTPQYSPISEASMLERFITLPKILFHYLTLFFYPHTLSISQHFVVRSINLQNFWVPLILITLTLIGLIHFYLKKLNNQNDKKFFIFAFAWMFFGFGLISNIIPLDMTIAERWFYFPIIGMLFTTNILINYVNESYKKYLAIILIGFSIFFIITSFNRNLKWKDGYILYSTDIQTSPNSFDLNNNIGVELYRKNKKDEELYKKTLESSDYHLAHINLCRLYTVRLKEFTEAEKVCELSVQKLPDNLQLWFFLTIAKYQNGKQAEALENAKALSVIAPSNETRYLLEKISKKEKLDF